MNEGLEVLEKLENDECYTDYEYRVAYDIIRKELKALEIIREKKLHIQWIQDLDGNWHLQIGQKDQSKALFAEEEYDLLKEVLI